MNCRMLKGVFMYLMLVVVVFLNFYELDKIACEREERVEAMHKYARLYVNAKPFERWIEEGPDGEPTRYELRTAYREGVLLWVLRESGHYVEDGSLEEFTVDRELPFEEGMVLLHTKRAKIDATPEWTE